MDYAVFLAIALGLSAGTIIGYRSSKVLPVWLGKPARAPRLVQYCSWTGALLFLLPSLFLSIVVGGTLGGGWGEAATVAVGYGSLGVPVGLAVGITVILGGGVAVGTLIGGMVGRLLSHILPESVLTNKVRL
jgi:hypothetical protein